MLYRQNNFVEKIIEEKKERRQGRETPDKLHETNNRMRIQCFQAADKRHNRIMENNCTPILPSNPFFIFES